MKNNEEQKLLQMTLKPTNYKYFILIALSILTFSCKHKSNSFVKNPTWEKFQEAINNNDLAYLMTNSCDSIKCIDCIKSENEKLQSSEYIFKNYRNEFYNKKLLNGKKYSAYQNDTIIRINYSFENSFEDESFNIIYMFDKKENSFLLTGMITVP
jgi:hypothetical protein